MPTTPTTTSIAVLPFLKTTEAITLGSLTFRSTDRVEELPEKLANHVITIREMLYLQGDLRLRSASYTTFPSTDHIRPPFDTEHLEDVQAVIAYCYAMPRHEFGDLFLSSEHASMALFTPDHQIPLDLVQPSYHVIPAQPPLDLPKDRWDRVEGYAGLYNFRNRFWATKGSRLYGPIPHVTLIHAQDLAGDIQNLAFARADIGLLVKLLTKSATELSRRVFTAIRWFNAANDSSVDEATAIVNLAIAFEALLALPSSEKTDRLVDAVSMLLGRFPRLDSWTKQFYDARSRIVHEGRASQLRFVATDLDKRSKTVEPLYQSLLSYGRQIFQVCVGALLSGADLAEQSGIEQTLVTNQERFEKICKLLDNQTEPIGARIRAISPLVEAIARYQYVPETNITVAPVLGAIQRAAQALSEHNESLAATLNSPLQEFIKAPTAKNNLPKLEKLEALGESFSSDPSWHAVQGADVVGKLVQITRSLLMFYYYQVKDAADADGA